MNDFGWTFLPSGLALREDSYSWQGSTQQDNHFFLRRSKDEPNVISDLLVGNMDDETVAAFFSEFLTKTGGLVIERAVIIDAIASRDDPKSDVVAGFDRLVRIARLSFGNLHLNVADAMLEEYRGKWRALIKLS